MPLKILIGALAVFVFGWSPILIYAAFGPPDGNPIGLGLLAWMSTPVALILVTTSGIAAVLGRRTDRRA